MHVEESVDQLIRKLENQGKKIKIIEDKEDIEEDLPQKSTRKGGVKAKSKGKTDVVMPESDDKKVDEIQSKLKEKEDLLNDNL